jgi:hypothetical protein
MLGLLMNVCLCDTSVCFVDIACSVCAHQCIFVEGLTVSGNRNVLMGTKYLSMLVAAFFWWVDMCSSV